MHDAFTHEYKGNEVDDIVVINSTTGPYVARIIDFERQRSKSKDWMKVVYMEPFNSNDNEGKWCDAMTTTGEKWEQIIDPEYILGTLAMQGDQEDVMGSENWHTINQWWQTEDERAKQHEKKQKGKKRQRRN